MDSYRPEEASRLFYFLFFNMSLRIHRVIYKFSPVNASLHWLNNVRCLFLALPPRLVLFSTPMYGTMQHIVNKAGQNRICASSNCPFTVLEIDCWYCQVLHGVVEFKLVID
jgi:hypothetical protein